MTKDTNDFARVRHTGIQENRIWNVKVLYNKEEELNEDFEKVDIDILAINKTKKKEERIQETNLNKEVDINKKMAARSILKRLKE